MGWDGRSATMPTGLTDVLADLKEQEALALVQERLTRGEDPLQILRDCRLALEIVGRRFENREYFIPDLIYSGEILKEIVSVVRPNLTQEQKAERLGKVVLGTVQGDIHDIGKNIVSFMLDVNGFEVHDLGVDVPPRIFVEKLEATGAGILALSGFLTQVFDAMRETVEAIRAAGLRDKVQVMIGGAQIDERVRAYTGADAQGADAMAAVALARTWAGGKGR
jgi:5-methyltetrahydrofolate--homocysteine methyltransferase